MFYNLLQRFSINVFGGAILAFFFFLVPFFTRKGRNLSIVDCFNIIIAFPLDVFKRIGIKKLRLLSLCLLLFITFGFCNIAYPSNQIGSPLEMEYYSAQYIVNVSKTKTTFYRLPADIKRDYEYSDSKYIVEKVYWPNGGYLYFGDDNLMLPEREYELESQDGRIYSVVLTKERVSPPFEMQRNSLQMVLFSFSVIVFFCCCCYLLNLFCVTFSEQKTKALLKFFSELPED